MGSIDTYRKLQAKLSFPGENIKQEEVASNRLLRLLPPILGEKPKGTGIY